ncbi:transposable element tcb2 transposase [Plakobranchus ocellatus]|uniref:Transposable element tcb2 transposase n=1 Tax=Plakobranchus ocellatus TaxID=259542 RepID=A0AAV4D5C1_9GAST|nr:transposable element tcb2 transposase [Plakobranchus ocellatus]
MSLLLPLLPWRKDTENLGIQEPDIVEEEAMKHEQLLYVYGKVDGEMDGIAISMLIVLILSLLFNFQLFPFEEPSPLCDFAVYGGLILCTSSNLCRCAIALDSGKTFSCVRCIIRNLLERFQQRGVITDLPRSGRPRITTCAEDRFIQLQHLSNLCLTAQSTAENFQGSRKIIRDTALKRSSEVELYPHRPAKRQQVHRRNRLQWTMQHRRWTMRQ